MARLAAALVLLLVAHARSFHIGVNTHNIDVTGIHQHELSMIADAFTWIRMDLNWASIEKSKGVYDFVRSGYDDWIAGLEEHHLGLIGILSPSNPLYAAVGTNVVSDEGIDAYAAMMASFASRYQHRFNGTLLLEVVNEPNSTPEYVNATKYAQLVAATASACHATEPQSQIVGPASANIDFSWLTQLFEHKVLRHFDQLTVHPYRSDQPETAAADFAMLRSLVDEYTPVNKATIPIHSGEWGYCTFPTGGTQIQSAEQHGMVAVRSYLVTIAAGAGISIWYDWRDGSPNTEIMGMVENTPLPAKQGGYPFKPKPAYNGTKILSQMLAGYAFEGRRPIFQNGRNTDDDWLLVFDKQKEAAANKSAIVLDAGSRLLVVWTSASFGHVVRIPGGMGCYAAFDWLGRPVGPNGKICEDPRGFHVNATSSPTYLVSL
jgi:hypothetical protein